MAVIGYAQASTTDQQAGLEGQLRDLERSGCTKIIQELLSSTAAKRPQLEAALNGFATAIRFLVTKLDRRARSLADRETSEAITLYVKNTDTPTFCQTERPSSSMGSGMAGGTHHDLVQIGKGQPQAARARGEGM